MRVICGLPKVHEGVGKHQQTPIGSLDNLPILFSSAWKASHARDRQGAIVSSRTDSLIVLMKNGKEVKPSQWFYNEGCRQRSLHGRITGWDENWTRSKSAYKWITPIKDKISKDYTHYHISAREYLFSQRVHWYQYFFPATSLIYRKYVLYVNSLNVYVHRMYKLDWVIDT